MKCLQISPAVSLVLKDGLVTLYWRFIGATQGPECPLPLLKSRYGAFDSFMNYIQ